MVTPSENPLHLKNLITLGPAKTDLWVSVRCALGIFLPLFGLILANRLDLAVFAVFAAFTNVYGRVPGHVDRLLTQLKVGGTFWVTMLAGYLSSRYLIDHSSPTWLWTVTGLTAIVSGVATAWAGYTRIRPGGSLFHIFAFAAIASSPATAPLGDGMFVASATIGLALVLGQLGRLSPSRRTPWTVTAPRPLSPGERSDVAVSVLMHVLAVLVSGAVSTLLSSVLHIGHTYWALVAAVVPLAGHTTRHGIARGVHRILGTFSGLCVLALIMLWHPPLWVIVLVIGLCQFMTELVVNRNYFFAQTFVTPLALLGSTIGHPLTTQTMIDRLVETIIGCGVGMIGVVVLSTVLGARRRRRLAQDPDAPDDDPDDLAAPKPDS
ncbi:FUSC family protein [Granulicoccus phenolivorans]|uniref:FUSC family protein n=1 Tax=Granulicoccus phenolivorans TaxID=266854 RepID=UPI0004010107|nr:FUSC family protein [Granulicoccus phenolivorans]